MAHKILLVDDDRGIIEVIKKILEAKQYEVIVAFDGQEGIDKVKSDKPDLILLDIRMPSMNGYEFMRTLRTNYIVDGKSMVPVIMLTAKEEMEEVFKLEGDKGYLVKPVESETLIEKIEEVLSADD